MAIDALETPATDTEDSSVREADGACHDQDRGGPAPGLMVAAIGAGVALTFNAIVPSVSTAVVGVAIGAAATNLGVIPEWAKPGLAVAARRVLRLAVVLLGLRLSVAELTDLGLGGLVIVATTVAATFFGVQLLGRLLGLPKGLSLLVATGYAVCGVSAIAAVRPSVEADDDEVAAAMGLVTFFGTAAMITLPVMAGVMTLTDEQFGVWAGASVHDVAQVVATAATAGSGVVTTAVAVKLTRVALLAPLVVGMNVATGQRRTATHRSAKQQGQRPPILPLFVIGFLVMVAVRSTGAVPDGVLQAAGTAERWLMVTALVGLGAGIRIDRFRSLGLRPVLLGLLAWMVVAVVALLTTVLLT